MNTVTITFKLPLPLQQELLQKVVSDGYGMRGKSKWIIEAISQFLSLINYPELVDIASESGNLDCITSIRVPIELDRAINESILIIRKLYPLIEGVRSNLIRASICQRLIRDQHLSGI